MSFVDDGSSDGTLRHEGLSGAKSCGRYVSFSRNFGKEGGLIRGLAACNWRLGGRDGCRPSGILPSMLLEMKTLLDKMQTWTVLGHGELVGRRTLFPQFLCEPLLPPHAKLASGSTWSP